ncbi:microfibril-associated glycoprotein 4-like [Mytilus californianus]|uniref:microfibril-associated glycoprotein 4-like n=1 Tax=Mytilus californianus TaxID=6549 RepID=UPI0022463AEE|nr:microfibril-associated glycoprotein 4-like [Mytilus californianus]
MYTDLALYPPHDCADIPLRCGSGVYRIHPTTSAKFDVYCEMETEDSGWTVIQRRLDGSTNFYKGWAAYEHGFGNLTHEFWLGDSLTYHNGYMFSTYDRDNDIHLQNCAVIYEGAWWYQRCHSSNLNGVYLSGIKSSRADGVIWYEWKGHYYSLKSTRLMIKKM